MGTLSRIVAAIFIALFAGLVTAGEHAAAKQAAALPAADVAGDKRAADAPAGFSQAWVGEYRVRDAHGERKMTIVRDATRVEYRVQHLPIRVWRQVADGVELQELHPERGESITYAAGDLRARNREPQWNQIASLIDPTLRDRLTAGRNGQAFGETLQRYRGLDAQSNRIELDWLTASAMPARYRIVAARGTETPGLETHANETIELRSMHRLPAKQAFTATDGLRDTDGADVGD
jgi:hypothetical protein